MFRKPFYCPCYVKHLKSQYLVHRDFLWKFTFFSRKSFPYKSQGTNSQLITNVPTTSVKMSFIHSHHRIMVMRSNINALASIATYRICIECFPIPDHNTSIRYSYTRSHNKYKVPRTRSKSKYKLFIT